MGVGMPEYLLLFRKPPTDMSNSYADIPVLKSKQDWDDAEKQWRNPNGYSRSRWQIDAHGYARSNGNRPLLPEEIQDLKHHQIFKMFRKYSLENIYDFEAHVKLGEALEEKRRLPVTFMLLQPQSWHPDVWTDITRMRTLNGAQSAKGKIMHLCPMQFDIAERVIAQMSNPGDVVFDPFAGLGTVPMMAVQLGRFGVGTELSANYFTDSCYYIESAAKKRLTPTLFDIAEEETEEEFEIEETAAVAA